MTVEQFKALPKKEKKIAVAKDVIAQLKKGKYIAHCGTYCDLDVDFDFYEKDAKKNFSKIESCRVCAVGSALVSTVRFANSMTIREMDRFADSDTAGFEKANKLLGSVFTAKELLLMEYAFEGDNGGRYGGNLDENLFLNSEDKEKAYDFRKEFEDEDTWDVDEDALLTAIMKNIVKHGTFRP